MRKESNREERRRYGTSVVTVPGTKIDQSKVLIAVILLPISSYSSRLKTYLEYVIVSNAVKSLAEPLR